MGIVMARGEKPTRYFREYGETFSELLGIEFTDEIRAEHIGPLESEGRTEYSICYAIWRSKARLIPYTAAPDFWDRFIHEVCKWSWAKNDPRWKQYYSLRTDGERQNYMHSQGLMASLYERNDEAEKLALRIADDNSKGVIYFVQGEYGGPIKIGFSTDLRKRLGSLQSSNPYKLILLMAIPGSRKTEQGIHDRLNAHWLRGEWYNDAPAIYEKIERLREKHRKIYEEKDKAARVTA